MVLVLFNLQKFITFANFFDSCAVEYGWHAIFKEILTFFNN
jgi:hypothetical protein